ncbi:YgaP-like transmembrane domain [Orbus wheelerorum]|uniref:YgaP-like transmembrane domain n=1 Tax=Orbus wheelerorum TaxID=3074111 RepID=UPI00370D5482
MLNLKRNLQNRQRFFRLILSIIIGLITTYFIYSIILKITIFIIVLIFASTALIGFCPMRTIINRIKMDKLK